PPRVTRFRRGAIILLAGVSAAAIAGAAWLALQPVSLELADSEAERPAGVAKAPVDALADAPTSYDDVPQLGPPLPGDLGRPILKRSREVGAPVPMGSSDAAAQAAQEREAERQRLAAAQRAAR